MPIYKNLPKTKKKKTDEFFSLIDHGVHFFNKYKVLFISLIVAMTLGGILAIFWQQNHQKQLVVLETKLYKALEAKDNAAIEKTIEEYRNYPSARLAIFTIIQSLVDKGEGAAALALLEKHEAKVPSGLKPLVLLDKARLYWQLGKNDEALQILDDKDLGDESPYVNEALFIKAQILEKTGKIEEAKSLFERLAATDGIDQSVKKIAQLKSAQAP